MENEAKFNSTDFRVASFSCYLKPRENKQNCKRFSHIFRRASRCLTMKPDPFAFPDLTAKHKQFEEKSRKSFEVFRSEATNKGDIMKNLERKMSVLTWDAVPQDDYELMSLAEYDDVASDASSDLFEIEIFSRNGSFAEFSSAYSDSDETRTCHTTTTATCQPPVKNKTILKKPQKTTAAGLLGCKSQHSVKVAEPVYKTTNKSKH